jgi:hypothetical protein
MQHPKPEHEDSMNDQTISTVTTTSRRSILVGSAGVLAAAGLSATTLATAAEVAHLPWTVHDDEGSG